jgi:hypothetical protein
MDFPVIIGGMERSGTSLVRAILGSHPDLAIFQWDLPLWRRFYLQYKGRDLNRSECEKLLCRIQADEKALQTDSTPRVARVLEVLEEREAPFRCEHVFGAYLKAHAERRGRPRWGLKTPTNEFHARSIFDAYPRVEFVHVIRDPRDVITSMMKTDFVRSVSLAVNPRYFNPNGVLSWWKMSAMAALQNQNYFEGQYHVLKYEDVVSSTEDTISEVCSRIGLEYKSEMLNMDGHSGWQGHNSQIDQGDSGGKIRNTGNRFPRYLDSSQVSFVEDILGDMMGKHGYRRTEEPGSTWKARLLHLNYSASPLIAGLRGAYRAFFQEGDCERRRKSTDDLFDYR